MHKALRGQLSLPGITDLTFEERRMFVSTTVTTSAPHSSPANCRSIIGTMQL